MAPYNERFLLLIGFIDKLKIMDIPEKINTIYKQLHQELSTLSPAVIGEPVAWVYKPLDYAWEMHSCYIKRYTPEIPGSVLFMGMNPGPDGMGQTGIPFGEVGYVRDYLGLKEIIHPLNEYHPKKPVMGLDWHKNEPSGKRLWGYIAEISPDPRDFFSRNFIINHCPLLFLSKTGSNIATATLNTTQQAHFLGACDRAAGEIIQLLQPRALVGIGAFAAKAFERIRQTLSEQQQTIPVVQILHPSPASPAANHDWKGQVRKTLEQANLWPLIG